MDDERSDERCHHTGDIHFHIGEWFDECESNGDDNLYADSNQSCRLSHIYANCYRKHSKCTNHQRLHSQSHNYQLRFQQHAELVNERSDEYCHHAWDIHFHIGEWFDECKSDSDDNLYAYSDRCRRLSHLYANRYGKHSKRTNHQRLHSQSHNYQLRFQQHAELGDERSDEYCHHAGDIHVHVGERFDKCESNDDDHLHADGNRCRRLSHIYANRYSKHAKRTNDQRLYSQPHKY